MSSLPLTKPALGLLTLVAVALLFAAGCGLPASDKQLAVHPASGTIKYQGKPAAGAKIVLLPKVVRPDAIHEPQATVAEDGTFKLGTYGTGDGAPEGDYTATITWRKFVNDGQGNSGVGPNVLPKKYEDPKTSGIEVKIAAGANSIPEIVIQDK